MTEQECQVDGCTNMTPFSRGVCMDCLKSHTQLQKKCPECGILFDFIPRKYHSQIYCSSRCRIKAYNRKNRDAYEKKKSSTDIIIEKLNNGGFSSDLLDVLYKDRQIGQTVLSKLKREGWKIKTTTITYYTLEKPKTDA